MKIKKTTHDVGNPGLGLKLADKYAGIKPLNLISILIIGSPTAT